MSYAERRRRKDTRAKPGRLDRSSSWSVHAFGACLPGCIWCELECAYPQHVLDDQAVNAVRFHATPGAG